MCNSGSIKIASSILYDHRRRIFLDIANEPEPTWWFIQLSRLLYSFSDFKPTGAIELVTEQRSRLILLDERIQFILDNYVPDTENTTQYYCLLLTAVISIIREKSLGEPYIYQKDFIEFASKKTKYLTNKTQV
jgi:hypothetical protein